MKASELRIGNYVNRLGKQTHVDSIQRAENIDYVSTRLSGAVTINQIEPIPLTEEWLIKFGFVRDGNMFLIESHNPWCEKIKVVDFTYSATGAYERSFLLPIGDGDFYMTGKFARLNFVHQLQNIYFSITEKELKLTQP